jgi:hypothetical protein
MSGLFDNLTQEQLDKAIESLAEQMADGPIGHRHVFPETNNKLAPLYDLPPGGPSVFKEAERKSETTWTWKALERADPAADLQDFIDRSTVKIGTDHLFMWPPRPKKEEEKMLVKHAIAEVYVVDLSTRTIVFKWGPEVIMDTHQVGLEETARIKTVTSDGFPKDIINNLNSFHFAASFISKWDVAID